MRRERSPCLHRRERNRGPLRRLAVQPRHHQRHLRHHFRRIQSVQRKMYCAFLLRALGYEDGVDFLYADTLDFAMLHGLFNLSMLDAAPFLRDDLAAVTYQALGADLKDGQHLSAGQPGGERRH